MGAPRGTAHHAQRYRTSEVIRQQSGPVTKDSGRRARWILAYVGTFACTLFTLTNNLGNPWTDEMTASSDPSRSSHRKPRNLASHRAHVLDVNRFCIADKWSAAWFSSPPVPTPPFCLQTYFYLQSQLRPRKPGMPRFERRPHREVNA
jgi:hypothetical protein